jgi:hypothetical protein
VQPLSHSTFPTRCPEGALPLLVLVLWLETIAVLMFVKSLARGQALLASVGSTEASDGRLARVGRIEPTHPGSHFAARCALHACHSRLVNGYNRAFDREGEAR